MQNVNGVQAEMTNVKVRIHDENVDIVLVPRQATYNDSQYGDFVVLNASGQCNRASSDPATLPYGLTVGAVLDSNAYPAFGGKYVDGVLVAVLRPGTEIAIPEIDANGNYVQESNINAGQNVYLIYNSTTKRWGVRTTGTNVRGVVVRRVDRMPQSDEPDYLIVRLV